MILHVFGSFMLSRCNIDEKCFVLDESSILSLNRNTQVPFVLEGQWGVLEYMAQRLKKNGICVVVIAEGAGQVEIFKIFITPFFSIKENC